MARHGRRALQAAAAAAAAAAPPDHSEDNDTSNQSPESASKRRRSSRAASRPAETKNDTAAAPETRKKRKRKFKLQKRDDFQKGSKVIKAIETGDETNCHFCCHVCNCSIRRKEKYYTVTEEMEEEDAKGRLRLVARTFDRPAFQTSQSHVWHRTCCHRMRASELDGATAAEVDTIMERQGRLLVGDEDEKPAPPPPEPSTCTASELFEWKMLYEEQEKQMNQDLARVHPNELLNTSPQYQQLQARSLEAAFQIREDGTRLEDGAVVLILGGGMGSSLVALRRLGLRLNKVIHVEPDKVANHVLRWNHDPGYNKDLLYSPYPTNLPLEHIFLDDWGSWLENDAEFRAFYDKHGPIDLLIGHVDEQVEEEELPSRNVTSQLQSMASLVMQIQKKQQDMLHYVLEHPPLMNVQDRDKIRSILQIEWEPPEWNAAYFSPCYRRRAYFTNIICLDHKLGDDHAFDLTPSDFLTDGYRLPCQGEDCSMEEYDEDKNSALAPKAFPFLASVGHLDGKHMDVFKETQIDDSSSDGFTYRPYTANERAVLMGFPDGYLDCIAMLYKKLLFAFQQTDLRSGDYWRGKRTVDGVVTEEDVLEPQYHCFSGAYHGRSNDFELEIDHNIELILKLRPFAQRTHCTMVDYGKHLVGRSSCIPVLEHVLQGLRLQFGKPEVQPHDGEGHCWNYPYVWVSKLEPQKAVDTNEEDHVLGESSVQTVKSEGDVKTEESNPRSQTLEPATAKSEGRANTETKNPRSQRTKPENIKSGGDSNMEEESPGSQSTESETIKSEGDGNMDVENPMFQTAEPETIKSEGNANIKVENPGSQTTEPETIKSEEDGNMDVDNPGFQTADPATIKAEGNANMDIENPRSQMTEPEPEPEPIKSNENANLEVENQRSQTAGPETIMSEVDGNMEAENPRNQTAAKPETIKTQGNADMDVENPRSQMAKPETIKSKGDENIAAENPRIQTAEPETIKSNGNAQMEVENPRSQMAEPQTIKSEQDGNTEAEKPRIQTTEPETIKSDENSNVDGVNPSESETIMSEGDGNTEAEKPRIQTTEPETIKSEGDDNMEVENPRSQMAECENIKPEGDGNMEAENLGSQEAEPEMIKSEGDGSMKSEPESIISKVDGNREAKNLGSQKAESETIKSEGDCNMETENSPTAKLETAKSEVDGNMETENLGYQTSEPETIKSKGGNPMSQNAQPETVKSEGDGDMEADKSLSQTCQPETVRSEKEVKVAKREVSMETENLRSQTSEPQTVKSEGNVSDMEQVPSLHEDVVDRDLCQTQH